MTRELWLALDEIHAKNGIRVLDNGKINTRKAEPPMSDNQVTAPAVPPYNSATAAGVVHEQDPEMVDVAMSPTPGASKGTATTPAEMAYRLHQDGGAGTPPPPQEAIQESPDRGLQLVSLTIHVLLLIAALSALGLGIYLWVRWPLDQFVFVGWHLVAIGASLFLLVNLGLMFTASSRRVPLFLYLLFIVGFVCLYVFWTRRIDTTLMNAGNDWSGSDSGKLVFEKTFKCCGYNSIDDMAVLPCPATDRACAQLIEKWSSRINRYSWNIMYVILGILGLHMIVLIIIIARGQPKKHEQVLA